MIQKYIYLLLLLPTYIQAAEWQIDPGDSIQSAIDHAASGDTIHIQRARYNENLIINKPITLIGENRPTISGNFKDDTIRITSPDVTLDGLIITNSGDNLSNQNAGVNVKPGSHNAIIRNCDISYNLFGIYFEGVKNPVSENNIITGKRDYDSAKRGNGIQLYNTTGAKIIGNNISFVRDSIYVDVSHHAVFSQNKLHHSRYGTHYMNSYYNLWENNDTFHNRGGLALMEVRNQTVRNNRAWGNSDHGIMLRTIQDSVIENNIVAGNARGFFIYDAEYNTLKNNLIVDNDVGIHYWAGSQHNKIDQNTFVSNQTQVKYVASYDQVWGEEHGNYWSNYLGWDRNGDGVGDVAYEANDIVDRLSWRHPMMKLLLASPAVQTLRLVSQQFPLLRATSIIDKKPQMHPLHTNWSEWLGKHYR